MDKLKLAIHYHGVKLITFWMWVLEGYLDGQIVIPRQKFSSRFVGSTVVAPGVHRVELRYLNRLLGREIRRSCDIVVPPTESGCTLDVSLSRVWGTWSHPRVQILGTQVTTEAQPPAAADPPYAARG